jgi:hypothetical protein
VRRADFGAIRLTSALSPTGEDRFEASLAGALFPHLAGRAAIVPDAFFQFRRGYFVTELFQSMNGCAAERGFLVGANLEVAA